MQINQNKIELFKKISETHFATDYSSADWLYPPLFAWNRTRDGDKIQSGNVFRGISSGPCGLYIHFPFCAYKCTFCRQFSLAVSEKKRYEDYVDLVIKEIKLYSPHLRNERLSAIYFGGGTPTLFNLEKILEEIYKNFNLHRPLHLNIEATPDSLNKEKLLNLKRLGLTRLLIGVQSFDSKTLNAIGRPANQLELFQRLYDESRKIDIPSISIELVAGLPEQTFESFIKDLKRLIELRPNGIHIYAFKQTPLTILGRMNGVMEQSRFNMIREMRKAGSQMLREAGYSYCGDDYVLSDSGRNPIVSMSSFFAVKGLLALGASSMGYCHLSSNVLVKTFNTLDLKNYTEMILRGAFPVEKFFYFNSEDEILRSVILRAWHIKGFLSDEDFQDSQFDILKELNFGKAYSRFKEEFLFLEKTGMARVDSDFSRIVFLGEDIYSKIFYSPEVLRKCQEILDLH